MDVLRMRLLAFGLSGNGNIYIISLALAIVYYETKFLKE